MARLLLAWALPVALAERIWEEFREDVGAARQSFLLQQRGGEARDSFGNLQQSGLAKEQGFSLDGGSGGLWQESKGSGRQLPACVGGVLNLSGTYEIWNETVLPGCDVVAHSAVVHIRSQAHQLYFLGSVAFRGQLEVRGRKGELSTACVSVGGNLTVRGDLSFHSCHNGKTLNPLGGGLTVDGDLHLEEGALRFENCSGANRAWKYPGGEGGAFYVQGAYRQRAGTLEAVGCYTQGRGGTFKVKENFEVYGGNVSIRNSSALQGGSIVAHHFKVFGGDVSIRDSWADEDGGAIKAAVLVAGGGVSIRNARAKNGGAIHSWKPSEVSGGVLRIFNASAREDGGAMKADKGLRQTGGVILLERASAGNSGGGLAVPCRTFNISAGQFRCQGCSAKRSGGGIHVQPSGGQPCEMELFSLLAPSKQRGVLQTGGRLFFEECTAGVGGGAISGADFNSSGGDVQIERCNSEWHGGAVLAQHVGIFGGAVSIRNTSAKEEGGGAILADLLAITGGRLLIQNASAKADGGAILSTEGIVQSSGQILLTHATAGGSGGGLAIQKGDVNVSGGEFQCHQCFANSNGGAIFVHKGTLRARWSRMDIENVSAEDRGGVIFVGRDAHFEEGLQLGPRANARSSEGGCLFVLRDLFVTGPTVLSDCHASGSGGAIWVRRQMKLDDATFIGCYAPSTSAFMSLGDGHVGRLFLNGSIGMKAVSAGHFHSGDVDCNLAEECRLEGGSIEIGQLKCSRGMGRRSLAFPPTESCEACPEDHVRLTLETPNCVRCPTIPQVTLQCEPTKLILPAGFMVVMDDAEVKNLSNWYRCPSESACPGGYLNASAALGEPVQVVRPMCTKGYEGRGCTRCAADYARADGNVLQCVPCAKSPRQALQYISFHMAKNFLLFVSAVASVTGAAQKQAASAILLNQLMAFAAVAGIAVSGVMQTDAFHRMQERSQEMLDFFALPVLATQGQGAGSPMMSAECLLSMLSMDRELYHTHALLNLWPLVLVVLLALIKGGWLAVIVGSNVFLADFTAAFGKYLVVFRVRPESVGGELCWDFLPPGPRSQRIAQICACIAACFALGVGSWAYVVQSRVEPLQRHVAYLMRPYKTVCSTFEIERLVRKMLLALAVAVLPVSLSPALQMETVSIILTASLVLNLRYHPYEVEYFNYSEAALLILALTMTGLTTCLVANDLHWARSALSQETMILVIFALAAGVCLVMMLRFALAFARERRRLPKEAVAET